MTPVRTPTEGRLASNLANVPQTRFRWDAFRLDMDAYRLERDGVWLALEPKAVDLLALLVSRPGHLFTKQEIFEAVWPDTNVTDHALTRVVAQLRRVLGDDSRDARYIETVPTRGYRWVCPVEAGGPVEPGPTVAAATVDARAPNLAPPSSHRHALAVGTAIAALGLLVALIGARGFVGVSTGAPTAGDGPAVTGAVPWPVQVTTHPGLDLDPAFSPRGDALAFSSERTGAFEIYIRSMVNGATDVPLTSDGAHNVQPVWSPDGTRIAYHSAREGGIWIVPARGGLPRQIVGQGSRPAWSPDGRSIAFQSDERVDVTPSAIGAQAGSTIWMMGTGGEHARQLTFGGSPAGGHAAPAWSPDGRYVGFTVFEAGPDNGVWLLSLDSGRTSQLQRGRKLYELAFAPDGSALYAAGGEALISRFPFDPARGVVNGPAQPIPVAGVPSARGLAVSGDGTRLAFAGLSLSSQIWAQPVGSDGGARSQPQPLTLDTSRRNSMPVVSPDGFKVAYLSSRRGEPPNAWVMDIDGGNKVQVTSDEAAENKLDWLPDSRRLAYLSTRGETRGLWSADVVTRREALVSETGAHALRFFAKNRLAEMDLAPSMASMAFSVISGPEGRRRLFVTPVQSFAPQAMGDEAMSIGYPAWSPDESRVAVEIKDGSSTQAGVIVVATGVLTRLTSGRGQTWVRSWSADGRRIAVAALRDGTWSLRWIDVETGQQGEMMPASPPNFYVRYPDWSSTNDLVVFERGELRGNIWTLPLR